MKIELERADIQAITQSVLESIKPYLGRKVPENAEDEVMDMKGLCDYLKVTPKWVHERTHLHEMPFYKLSNKQLRFRKRKIDKWLDSLETPAFNPLSSKVRLLK